VPELIWRKLDLSDAPREWQDNPLEVVKQLIPHSIKDESIPGKGFRILDARLVESEEGVSNLEIAILPFAVFTRWWLDDLEEWSVDEEGNIVF